MKLNLNLVLPRAISSPLHLDKQEADVIKAIKSHKDD